MVLSNRFAMRGGALPSESELMLELATTRNVVRDALGLLRAEGLIERLQGAGTFVATEKILHRFDILHGVGEGYANRHRRMHGELPTIAAVPAPPVVAAKLGLEPGALCLRVDAWVGFDDAAFSLSTSYVAAELEEAIRATPFSGDWYEFLESLGFRLGTCAMDMEATVADEFVAPWLEVSPGAPLVLFTRLIFTEEGLPAEYGFVRVRADRIVLQVPLPRAARSAERRGLEAPATPTPPINAAHPEQEIE